MEKQRRITRHPRVPELDAVPTGAGQPQTQAPTNVQVNWGFNEERMDLQDLSVEAAYELLRGHLNIAPDVIATVNGTEATPGQRLIAGDTLEFVRAAGEKGAAG
jgi:hypothetical protein